MTKLSMNQAAKEAGIAKTTLLRAIKNNELSFKKNRKGHYEIDPSELFRVFPKTIKNRFEEPKSTPEKNHAVTSLERENRLLREMLEETRSERNKWRDQAQKITALIEDKSTNRKGFWARIFNY